MTLAGIRAMICALLCHTVWLMGKKAWLTALPLRYVF